MVVGPEVGSCRFGLALPVGAPFPTCQDVLDAINAGQDGGCGGAGRWRLVADNGSPGGDRSAFRTTATATTATTTSCRWRSTSSTPNRPADHRDQHHPDGTVLVGAGPAGTGAGVSIRRLLSLPYGSPVVYAAGGRGTRPWKSGLLDLPLRSRGPGKMKTVRNGCLSRNCRARNGRYETGVGAR